MTDAADGASAPSTDGNAEHFQRALDVSYVGVWGWEAATDAVTLSPMACELFGVQPGTVLSWTNMQRMLLNPEDAVAAAAAVERAIAERSTYTMEYRVKRPSD